MNGYVRAAMGSQLVWIGAGLFLISVGYNAWVAYLERQEHERGYLGFIVALGVLYTLMGAGIVVGLKTVCVMLVCFVCSGTPMIAGSVWRYVTNRANERREVEIATRRFIAIGREEYGDTEEDWRLRMERGGGRCTTRREPSA